MRGSFFLVAYAIFIRKSVQTIRKYDIIILYDICREIYCKSRRLQDENRKGHSS